VAVRHERESDGELTRGPSHRLEMTTRATSKPGLFSGLHANSPRIKARHSEWRAGRNTVIALVALISIGLHLVLRFVMRTHDRAAEIPFFVGLALGGIPLVYDLLKKIEKREFGSDLLAGVSIVTSVFLAEYLAGVLVVLMLSGGKTLESFAVGQASSVLGALAKRMPTIAHRRIGNESLDASIGCSDRRHYRYLPPRDKSSGRDGCERPQRHGIDPSFE
jgi:cation transport ATPase